MTFRAPEAFARFIAPKGSVALNGTSLTVNEVEGCDFGVNLIPHTQAVTTWARCAWATGEPGGGHDGALCGAAARVRLTAGFGRAAGGFAPPDPRGVFPKEQAQF